jgi:hypothetical protein
MLLVSPIGCIDRNTLALLVSLHLAANAHEFPTIRHSDFGLLIYAPDEGPHGVRPPGMAARNFAARS